MNNERYNTRVRQAISDKYVACNKRRQEITKQIIDARDKLRAYMNGDATLTYLEYIDLKSSIDMYDNELRRLEVESVVWNEAREVCLDIEDEMRAKKEK